MEAVARERSTTTARGKSPRRGGPDIPHAEDLARFGERLQSALREVLQALPAEIRSPRKLPSALGIDRSTCYRLWRVSRASPNRWDEIASHVPGAAAIRRFAAALKRHRLAVGLLDNLELATDQFDAFVHEKFRSQTRLRGLLEGNAPALASGTPTDAATGLSPKAAAFESALAINRSSIDLDGAIVLVTPSQKPECAAEVAMLLAYLGYRASPGGRPLIVHVGSLKEHPLAPPDPARTDDGLEVRDAAGDPLVGRSNHCVVPEFSSRPLPSVVRERSASRQLARLCVDPAQVQQLRAGFDVVAGFRLDPIPRSPKQSLAPFKGFVKAIDHPTRKLIVDVYMHRSFAKLCIPEATCHAPVPAWMHESEHARWAYRLPEYPDLHILPDDLSVAEDRAWPRYAAMAQFIFARCGANRSDYVGHRMSTTFPIWPASYKLAFHTD